MRKIRALAPAKVNLTFDIKGVMAEGYQEVETLLQAVDLQDDITIAVQESDQSSIAITCTNEIVPANLPLDDTNLMARAARLFFAQANMQSNFSIAIEIEKNIPIGAGLAGGSTDGAAVLVALNELFDKPFDLQQLCKIGSKLGADVPFCIVGGSCVGTGRGDVLTPLPSSIDFSYCIVKPRRLSVSTPWAYQRFDQYSKPIDRPKLPEAKQALKTGDLQAAIQSFGNMFQPVIFDAHPELVPIQQQMMKAGCWCCHLSGSGPALFAIVADREQAHFIRRKILKTDDLEFDYINLSQPDLGPPLEFYIAQSVSSGVTVLPPVQQAR